MSERGNACARRPARMERGCKRSTAAMAFDIDEVAKHNTANDCWIIIDKKVAFYNNLITITSKSMHLIHSSFAYQKTLPNHIT